MQTPTPNASEGTAPVADNTPAAPAPVPAPAAPVETPVATPAAQSSTPDLKAALAKMTPNERFMLATGRASELIKEEPAAAAPAVPAASRPAEPAPATPEPTPAPEAGDDIQPTNADDGKDAGRIRLKGDDYAIAVLAKSKGISILEAARIYSGQPATPAPAAPAAPEPAAAPAVDPVVANFDTQISETETQINKLLAERKAARDDLDNEGADKISDKIADLKADVRNLQNEKKGHIRNAQQQTEASYSRGVKEETARVYEKYPQLGVADSMERLALDAYVQKVIADPRREAELADPKWVSKVAEEFAAKHGIKPKTAGTAPVAPASAPSKPATITRQPPQQVLPPSGAKLLTGADGQTTPSASRPMTREDALARIRNDPEARRYLAANFPQSSAGARQ